MADRHDYHIFIEFELSRYSTLPEIHYLGTTPAAGQIVTNNGSQKTLQIEFKKSEGESWYGQISNTTKQHCLKEILSNFEKYSAELLGLLQKKARYKIWGIIPKNGKYKIKKCNLVQQEYGEKGHAIQTDIESIKWEESGRIKNFQKEFKANSKIFLAQVITFSIVAYGFGPRSLLERSFLALLFALILATVNLILALFIEGRRLKRA